MTPRDVDALTDAEWDAMVTFMRDEARAQRRAARRRKGSEGG
jgi:hypothetical protein